jgi:phosphonate transport system substrate-binding protein
MLKIPARLLIGGVLSILILGVPAGPAQSAEGAMLVIGRITDNPEKHQERLNRMAEYLAAELSEFGVTSVGTVMVDTEAEMADLMRAGKVDILSETPFVAVQLESEGLVDILMREWKKGVPEYHTVIVARKDGAVQSLADLAGRRVSFEDEGSTSGYHLPRDAMELAGLDLMRLNEPGDPVSARNVGYYFTGSESVAVELIHEGILDAGAISNVDWAESKTVPDELRQDLQVIHETSPVIRSVLMVNASIPAEAQDAIATVLEQMEQTPEGREVMMAYSKVARYDRIEGDALKGLEEARRIWLRRNGGAS